MDKKRSKKESKNKDDDQHNRSYFIVKSVKQVQPEHDRNNSSGKKRKRPTYLTQENQEKQPHKYKKEDSGSQEKLFLENIQQKNSKKGPSYYRRIQNENKKLKFQMEKMNSSRDYFKQKWEDAIEKLGQAQEIIRNEKVKLQENNEFTHKLINIKHLYYQEQNYSSFQKYQKMLINYTNQILSQKRQFKKEIQIYNKIHKIELKIKIYEAYNYILKNFNEETKGAYIKVWQLFYRDKFFQIINNDKIIYFLFNLWHQKDEEIVREIMIKVSLQNAMSLIKNRYPDLLKRKRKFSIQQAFGQEMTNFTHLIVKQPLIFCNKFIKSKVLQTIEIIKQSWYIRAILSQFIIGRRNYIFELKKNYEEEIDMPQISKTEVENKLKIAQVFFIDYPSTTTNGFTYSNDKQEKFPILINLFVLQQFFYLQDLTKCLNFAQSYIMYVFLHELAHSMIRKLSIISANESSIQEDDENITKLGQDIKKQRMQQGSNLKNSKQQQKYIKQKMDTGFLFEVYSFGNFIQQCYEKDYWIVSKLLKIKKKPKGLKKFDILQNFDNCENFLLRSGESLKKPMNQAPNMANVSSKLSKKQIQSIQQQSRQQIKSNQMSIKELNIKLNALKQKKQAKDYQKKIMQLILLQKQEVNEPQKTSKVQTQKNSQKQIIEKQQKEQKELKNQQIVQLIKIFQSLGSKQYKSKNKNSPKILMRQNLGKNFSMPIGCCNIFLQRMRQRGMEN